MRILIVNAAGGEEWRGGVERGIALSASLLAERDVEVSLLQALPASGDGRVPTTVLAHRARGRLARRVQNRTLDFRSSPTRDLESAVARSGADVVHTHNLPGVTTAIWDVARRQGLPVVHSLHDYYLLCPRASLMDRRGQFCGNHPSCRLRTTRLARWADAVSVVVGVSDAVLDAHRPLFANARLEVLRNPMVAFDPDSLRPPSRSPMTVGYIGGLTREKGIVELLAAAELLAGDTRFRFRIGGHGLLAGLVTDQAARLPQLTYVGAVRPAGKQAFFEGCDVGIIPSVWAEPGGPTHVLAEWLTAGRPVLVSLRGGLAEVGRESGAALPVKPTPDAIVAALRELAEPARWDDVLAARRRWDPQAEIDRWIGWQIELYDSLAGSGGGRPPGQ